MNSLIRYSRSKKLENFTVGDLLVLRNNNQLSELRGIGTQREDQIKDLLCKIEEARSRSTINLQREG